MYAIVLSLHNVLRWAVLLTGVYSVLRAGAGLLARGSWLPADEAARRIFPIALDIQFVLGAALWAFLSPLTEKIVHAHAFSSLHDPVLRFYAIDHGAAGLLALLLAHFGSVRARRLKASKARFQTILLFHGLALLLVLARTPWDRPFFHAP